MKQGIVMRVLVAVALLLWLVSLGYAFFNPKGLWAYYGLQQDIRLQAERNKPLKANNALLRTQVQAFQHNRSYVEGYIRRQFGFVRKDELFYLIPLPVASTTSAGSQDLSLPPPLIPKPAFQPKPKKRLEPVSTYDKAQGD